MCKRERGGGGEEEEEESVQKRNMQQLCDFSYRWHFFSAISSGRKSKSEKLMCTHTLLPRNRENGAKGKLRKWLLCHVGVCLLACVRLSAVREECCLSMYHVSHRVSVGV